jgi:hypothetical protein
MKRSALSSVFALLTVLAVVAIAVAADAPHRTKKNCADYLEIVKRNSAAVGMKPAIVAGSWGKLPVELQRLPGGSQNCGTVEGQPTIVSPAYGKDLETFYTPLFAKVGCQPLTCTIDSTRTLCKCKSDKKQHGMVVTDTGYEAFTLSLM